MSAKKVGLIFLLIFGFLIFASFNLLSQPLYLDEGLYIFWASLFHNDPNFAYVSMQDGKTPLFIWLTSFLNPFFQNYLYTGRIISIFAALVTAVSSAGIAWKIFGYKTAVFTFLLFLICPFFILISRMAFVDSLFIAFGNLSILSLFFAKDFIKNRKFISGIILAIFAGLFLGLGFMTKTTTRVFLVAEIAVIGLWILFEVKKGYKDLFKNRFQIFKNPHFQIIILLSILAVILVGLYFEILGYLRFGALRYWGMVSIKEADLTFSLREIFANLTGHTSGYYYFKNFPLFVEYLFIYFGTILVFFGIGVFQLFRKRENLWLVLIPVIFFLAVFLSAKIPASRYLAIIIPQVLIISAIGLNKFWGSKIRFSRVLTIGLLIVPVAFSSLLIFSPTQAIYASDDKSYFIESEINVPGFVGITEFLESKKENSVLGIEAFWGVTEGLSTIAGEKGIKTVVLNKLIPLAPEEDPVCLDGFLEDGFCWKLNLGGLKDYPGKEIYIYITLNQGRKDLLSKIADVEYTQELKRPNSGAESYLVKFNGYKKN